MLLLAMSGLPSPACTNNRAVQSAISAGWTRVEADKSFTFYLPESMRLVSQERCEECAWGSTYSDDRLSLYAEYTSWNEEFAPQYLAKQADYVKEIGELDSKAAKIQSWSLPEPVDGYRYTGEARVYDPRDGGLIATMSVRCKDTSDLETARRIFKTIRFR
jgi:hypothetical protein